MSVNHSDEGASLLTPGRTSSTSELIGTAATERTTETMPGYRKYFCEARLSFLFNQKDIGFSRAYDGRGNRG
jgi:hypothetical protein